MQCVLHDWWPLDLLRCLSTSIRSGDKSNHKCLASVQTYKRYSYFFPSVNFFQVEMAGFEALSQVLLACQSPALIAVLVVWVLICSSELWLALAEIWQRWTAKKTTYTHRTPVAAFDVFNSFVALVLLILSVLPDRCQHQLVGVTASIILNFGSYALGPLKMVKCSRNPVRSISNILGHF